MLIKHSRDILFSNTMSYEQAEQLRFGGVDNILKKKVRIKYEDMFCHPDSIGKKLTVLIDGAPGVGKTTLCSRIANDWANGTIQDLNRFTLVMLVPLRRISEAMEVDELFHMYTDHKKTREEVIDVVTGNAGSGIMLLLDGFDELTPELRNKSLFVDLINGRRLTNCTVFVTSRPFASQKLQRICNRHIEILGFSLDKIRCCIYSAFPKDKERANDLIRDLESREDLLSLCYIPMNCAIIIFVYKGENFHLPRTVTALYELYLTHALRRHASKIDLQEDFVNLKDLPNELKCNFGALAEIAYTFLIEDKFVFSQRDLGPNMEARTQLQIMGLVTSFSVSSGCGQTHLFQFLHLTIQEFLAAWHASQLSPEEQADIICDFSNSRLKLMRNFLAGITKLQGQNVRDAFNQSFKDALTPDTPGKKCNGTAVIDQLHMIYEAQSSEICQQVSRFFPEETILFKDQDFHRICTPFLCKVVSFFLSNSSCAWKKVSLDGLRIFNTACLQTFHVTGCSSSIQELVLHDGTLSQGLPLDSSSLIPKIPLFQKVESLSVSFSSPISDPDKCSVLSILADLFRLQHLQKLSLLQSECITHSFQGLPSVPLSVLAPVSVPNTLQEFHLCLSCSDPRVIEFLGSGLEVSKIRDFCLKFSNTDFIFDNKDWTMKVYLKMIALVLPYITKMKYLEHLSLSVPSDEHAQVPMPTASDDRLKSLHTMLKSTKTLKTLKIDIPYMIPSCVDYICDGLKSNSTLSELHITSYRSCDVMAILDSLSIHRMENISLEYFTSNELMKIWNVILNCNIVPLPVMAPPSVPITLQEFHLCLSCSDPRVIEFLGSGLEVSGIRDFCFKFSSTDFMFNDEYASRKKKVCLEMIALVLPYITKMKYLEHLSLSVPSDEHAQVPMPTASDDRLKSLHTILKSTKTLKMLKIDIPYMIPSCVDYICDGLKSNSTLSELHITSYRSCDLFSILDSLSIHRMENIYLEYFTSNELMKIWNVILNCNILSEFHEISVSRTLKLIRNSDSMKVQKVNIQWSYVDSCDAFQILNSLKDRCQNIQKLKLNFKGMLVSARTTKSKKHLLTEQQDTTQCKIGEILAYFLLNCECIFDLSAIFSHDHSLPLYLDLQMSFVTPYLSHGMSDFPQDSFLIHNKIIYTKYGLEHGNRFTSDFLDHNQEYNACSHITMTHCFELHLQPVSELPPHLQCLSPTLSSLQQIVSTQKCVGKITAHAKKCTPIIEKLFFVSEEDHDCWIYIAVDIRVMGSDHVTVQSQLKWIIDADKIECPYVKHVRYDWAIDEDDMKIAYPEYFRGDEEDLGDVISDIPFLKPQHQNTSQS